jgi:xanthine/uracil permease
MNVGLIILVLKAAVVAVTLLLIGSLTALARGRYRLHGRLNIVFFVLTLSALIGLELIAQLLIPQAFAQYLDDHDAHEALRIHLSFSVPAAVLLFAMLFTGVRHQRKVHIGLGVAFLIFWAGTFVTGVCFLPHELP